MQKYLADAGVASRRQAERLIAAGTVRVNGKVVREMGTTVAVGDRVEYAGRVVTVAIEREIVALNKPFGVVTTMRDPEGRRTVADLLRTVRPAGAARLVPVGRLDYDTTGLLLLTNDGELANKLTHPRYGVEKVYRATVRGRLLPDDVKRFSEGIRLEGRATAPARLRVVATRAGESVIDLSLHEGRNRQVRKMFETVGHPVLALTRIRFGPVSLGGLEPGMLRALTEREERALREAVANAEAAGDEGENEEPT